MKARKKYYYRRERGMDCEESRVLLRTLSREVKNEIGQDKVAQ